MSFADTTTVAPVLIADVPDWNEAYNLTVAWFTGIQPNRQEGEQRIRRREYPRLTQTYALPGRTVAELASLRARSMTELGSPVVVPIWTHRLTISNVVNSNTFDVSSDPKKRYFKIGSWLYVDGVNGTRFRTITGITSTVRIACNPADAGSLTLANGDKVYPCILGQKINNASQFIFKRLDDSEVLIAVEEL